jgi:type VI secretion system secreted protein VgrG
LTELILVYGLTMDAEMSRRLLSVDTPLGPGAFLLTGFSGREELSRPFRFELEMLSGRDAVDPAELVGRDVTWRVQPVGREPRFFHGIVRSFVAGGRGVRDLRGYRAVVVPRLWLLSRAADCRVFADRTLPEVVAEVFADSGFTEYESALGGSYPRRDYRVQYQETAAQFVARILEEEGAFFFFRREEGRHTLVLADGPGAFRECLEARPEYTPGVAARGRIATWERRYEIDPDGDGPPRDEVTGSGGCYSFTAGGTFTPQRRGAEGRSNLLVAVEHAAADNSFTPHGGGTAYGNTFTCVPDAAAFRPAPAAPRPVVRGLQTAVVVGPEGGEAEDDRGRVRVRLSWGRAGGKDENNIFWVRVGRIGTEAFRPRVGEEVLVEFLDGDPDRPLVTGRVGGGRAVEWQVGASLIRMAPEGVVIQGMSVTIEGHARAEVKGLMTSVGADAVLAVKGGATLVG